MNKMQRTINYNLLKLKKLNAEFECQSKLIRLKQEDFERDNRIAQELEARKREKEERDFEDNSDVALQCIGLKCNMKMICDNLQLLKSSGNSVFADNDDNAEHYVAAFRVELATKLVPKWDEGDVGTFIRTI